MHATRSGQRAFAEHKVSVLSSFHGLLSRTLKAETEPLESETEVSGFMQAGISRPNHAM